MKDDDLINMSFDDFISTPEYVHAKADNIYVNKESEELIDTIKMSTNIDESMKDLFVKLAGYFTQNLKNNMFKNQFELVGSYNDTSYDQWNFFLNNKIITKYIRKHKDTMLRSGAEANLLDPIGKNKRDNLKILESLEDRSDSSQKVIIMRLPSKYD